MRRNRNSLLSRWSALASFLIPLLVPPAVASPGDSRPSDERAELHRVFPPDRPSEDARLQRPARTLSTPAPFEPPADPVDWLDRVAALKKRIQVAAGLWPYPGAAMEYRVHRTIDRGDFTIQNVVFQSYFFHFVPANLYVPKGGDEKKPLVLMPIGYGEEGRLGALSDEEALALVESGAERTIEAARNPIQARCEQLARMGCMVLVFDPVGAGEQRDHDPEKGLVDIEQILRSQDIFGFGIWNTFMGLYTVWNHESVDRERIAVVGAADAALTALAFSALETRVRAVFVTGPISHGRVGTTLYENPAHLRIDTSDLEIAALTAPRALALAGSGSAECEVEKAVLPPLRATWRMLGAQQNVTAKCFPEHRDGFHVHAREMMYGWLAEHLALGFEGPIVEQPFEPLPPKELRAYDQENPAPPASARDFAGVLATLTDLSDKQLDQFNVETPHRLRVYRGIVFDGLQTMLATRLPALAEVTARVVAERRHEDRTFRTLVLARAESGEEVPAVLVVPDEWNGTVVVGVSEGGKADFFGRGRSSLAGAARVVDLGAAFLAPDVFQTGESANGGPRLGVDEERHRRNPNFTHCYNRSLLAERVHDVLTTIAYARTLDGVLQVNLVGTGDAGPWAIMARALAGDVESAGDAVQRTAAQWSWDFGQMRTVGDQNFLPGALRYGGIPHYAALVSPGELRIVGFPGQARPVAIPDIVYKAYNSLDAVGNVRAWGNERYGEVVDWLAAPAPSTPR